MTVFGNALTKVFGSRNDRLLKRYRRIVEQINAKEPEVRAKTDAELRERTQELRSGLIAGKIKLDDVMPEAFAIIREAMDRHIGIRQIFNPDSNFDPDKFDDKHLELYDSVQRTMIATGQDWQHVEIPRELYDAVRERYPESRPPFRARCFDVQLIGGLVLSEGKIAEMKTGEGKTFVAPLACFLRVLQGLRAHVITVNDYLVRRDATWVRPAFEHLGMTVGYLQQTLPPGGPARKEAYSCDITYGTNSEFGFDYLRDNMKERADLQVQGPLDFAIVDEVDSILIDEARTPLIISGPAHDNAPDYRKADDVARHIMELSRPWQKAQDEVDAAKRAIKSAEGDLDKAKDKDAKGKAEQRLRDAQKRLADAEAKAAQTTQYYEVEHDRKSVHLTHEGIAAAQEAAGVGSFYVGDNMHWPHLMEQAMRAHVVYERDKDYVIEPGQRSGQLEVVIVDEYTGRKMVGRQWSDGLHQAVEAKERVPIKQETQTLATITLQNFFKLYKALAGMTGTAQTEAEEFMKIYNLDVVSIPTNRPVIRRDENDLVYRTEQEKWESILEEIKTASDAGRPVLVGTTSVEKSEFVSRLLTQKYGIEHEVLNAKQHEREAHIVENAGGQHVNKHGETVGNVTIATNMAGRGTDIKPSKAALEAGGLHVIATERHTARRIDDQLRGRSGRQGDPGSSRFFVSLQDPLMKMFYNDWAINMLKRVGMEYGEAIDSRMVTKGIERAQKKVEERNFLARKNLLEYDEVMDVQRMTFYGMRQSVLEGRDIERIIWDMIGQSIEDAVDKYVTNDYRAAVLAEWGRSNFDVNIEPEDLAGLKRRDDVDDLLRQMAKQEVEDNIRSTLGEFMGEDPDDPSMWDTKSISSWAQSRFGVQLSQKQIRSMDADELREQLREAAEHEIDRKDTTEIEQFLKPTFALEELVNWASEKFSIHLKVEELVADAERGLTKPPAEIIEIIEQRARDAYRRREIEYPVDHTLALAFSDAPTIENAFGAGYVAQWANAKYGVTIDIGSLQGTPVRTLRDELLGYQEEMLKGGKLEKVVDGILAGGEDPQTLAVAFNGRFKTGFPVADFDPQKVAEQARSGGRQGDSRPPTAREIVERKARYVIRKELTDLEQFVLISIFDNAWKDHLYAMDMLKGGIGLQAFAERDPRVAYKKEGTRFFKEMLAGIRDRVTDLIFRVRVAGAAPQAKSVYTETAASHATVDDPQTTGGILPDAGMAEASESGYADAQETAAAAAGSSVRTKPKSEGRRQEPKERNLKRGKSR